MPSDATHDQYPEKVQAVGHSTFKPKPKMVSRPAVKPTTLGLQAPAPKNEGSDKDEEPKFSLKEVQQLLDYTLAARHDSRRNDSQGSAPGNPRFGDRRGDTKGKDIIGCEYCSKRGYKAYI